MIDRRWQILGILFLARSAMGFQFQSIASTAPFLMTDLRFGFGGIGSLIGLYMLPGILIAFPGGLLVNRFGDKAVCTAGLALMVVGGCLLGVSASPQAADAGRLISGTGAVLFNLVITKMATDWFAGREIVLAMGLVLASWPFGIAAALLLQPALAASQGWRAVMYLCAGLCAMALGLMLAAYRPPPHAAAARPPARLTLPPWRQLLPTIVAGVMSGNVNLALVLFFSFTPAVLIEQGESPITAAAWAGAGLWVLMVSVPLGGLLVQRSGRADAATALFSLLGSLALMVLPANVASLAAGIGFGLAVGPAAASIMAMPSRVLTPEHRAGGLGVFMTCYYAIVTLGPAGAGLLREYWGTSAAALLLGAVLMASNAALLALFTALQSTPQPAAP